MTIDEAYKTKLSKYNKIFPIKAVYKIEYVLLTIPSQYIIVNYLILQKFKPSNQHYKKPNIQNSEYSKLVELFIEIFFVKYCLLFQKIFLKLLQLIKIIFYKYLNTFNINYIIKSYSKSCEKRYGKYFELQIKRKTQFTYI